MEIFLTVRGDLILSGKDQLMELLFLAGLGLEGGEVTPFGRSEKSTKRKRKVIKAQYIVDQTLKFNNPFEKAAIFCFSY